MPEDAESSAAAKVCGTSEEMIFRHYRTWIPGLNPDAGTKVGRILGGVGGGQEPPSEGPAASHLRLPHAPSARITERGSMAFAPGVTLNDLQVSTW